MTQKCEVTYTGPKQCAAGEVLVANTNTCVKLGVDCGGARCDPKLPDLEEQLPSVPDCFPNCAIEENLTKP